MNDSSKPIENEKPEASSNTDAVEMAAERAVRSEVSNQDEQQTLNDYLLTDKQSNEQRRQLTAKELEVQAQRYGIPAEKMISKASQILGGRLGLTDSGKVLVADIGKDEIQTLKYGQPLAEPTDGEEVSVSDPDEVIAQDWDKLKKFAKSAGEAALEKVGMFVRRGHEDSFVSYAAARDAHELAGLDKWGLPKNTIGAILRNEQHFYKVTDQDQDKQVKINGTVFKADGTEDIGASIGPAQMQISNIRKLIGMTNQSGQPTYQFLQTLKDDPLRKALEPKNAALLTAAYLTEVAKDQVAHGIQHPTFEQIIYGYNDDVNSFMQGKERVFVCVSTPGQSNAEKIFHKSLKRERVPLDERVVQESAHVRNVKKQLEILNTRFP